MLQPLKTIVIGNGYAGKRFTRALTYFEVFEPNLARLSGVVDIDPAKLVDVRGGVSVSTDLSAALRDWQPEVAIVCVNERRHFEVLSRLCDSTVRTILCEKPLTATLAEARTILGQLNSRTVSMNMVERFSPIVASCRNWILARPHLTVRRIEFLWGKNRIRDPRSSMGVCSEAIHPIDLVRLLFGCERLEIDAAVGIVSNMQQDYEPVLDGVFMMFGDAGKPILGQSSFAWPRRDRRVVAFLSDGTELYRICLQFDSPRWDCDNLSIIRLNPADGTSETVHEAVTTNEDFPAPLRQVYKVSAFLRESLRSARGLGTEIPLVEAAEAFDLQRIIENVASTVTSRSAQLT